MYAVIGVTGHVGRVTGELLLKEKQPLRAIVRNAEKGAEWSQKGAEIAVADLHDAAALAAAMKGTAGVFIMTPPLLDAKDPMAAHDDMLAALSSALREARPEKIVYLSSIGAQYEKGTGAIKKLYDMEQTFRQLNLSTAGIRAAWFMENFIAGIDHAKTTGRLLSFLDPTKMAIPMVAAKDIGELAAALLMTSWSSHRIIELEGPCRYSADDVAMALGYHLKQHVAAEAIPEDQYAAVYQSFGFTPAAAALMAEMNEGFNSGRIVFADGDTEHVSGGTLLEDLLGEHLQ